MIIYHIAQKDEWAQAKKLGCYWPSSPDNCQFIHFSFKHQVLAVANLLFTHRKDLVLLEVTQEALGKDLKVENTKTENNEMYPHLYRTLNPKEVVREKDFLPSPDGFFYNLP